MFRRLLGCVVACCLVLALTPPVAAAQTPARSFDQLLSRVYPGATVTVTEASGRKVTGLIVNLSATSLTLLVGGTRHDLREADVVAVRQRQADPLANGALWGGGIGAGGLIVVSRVGLFADGPWRAGPTVKMAALLAGIGSGVGLTADALIKGQRLIYSRPATPPRVTVLPLIGPARAGVFVSVGF